MQIPLSQFPTSLSHSPPEFVHVPPSIQKLLANYFSSLYVCYTTQDITTTWHQLEKEIAMGCSISPIIFTTAFEIIFIGGRQMVGRVKTQTGQRLPPIWSYMDDITTLLQTATCTARLLEKLEQLLAWTCMKIKPTKSWSLSLWKGVTNDNICFKVDGQRIPLVLKEPGRSLGRMYTADLYDKHIDSAATTHNSQTAFIRSISSLCLKSLRFGSTSTPNVAP